MSRPLGLVRRLRNRALGALVLAIAFAACRPDRLLQNRGGSPSDGGSSSSSPTDARPPPRKHPPAPAPAPSPVPDRPPPSPGRDASSVHLALGLPEHASPEDEYLLVKPQYALSYNRHRNGANWVSWNLDASYFGRTPRHKGKFLVDASLPPGFYRVEDRDYAGSGYDRGHMV